MSGMKHAYTDDLGQEIVVTRGSCCSPPPTLDLGELGVFRLLGDTQTRAFETRTTLIAACDCPEAL